MSTFLQEQFLPSLLSAANSKHKISGFTHDFYNYPARFSPLLVREIINTFSSEGDLILDPFMGGGTTLVEASLLKRKSIGFDISSLSTFLASVKSHPPKTESLRTFDKWFPRMVSELSCHNNAPRPFDWIEKGYQKNLNFKETWPIRKLIEQSLFELSLVDIHQQEKDFIRCVILKTGQWALDSKKAIPSASLFKRKLIENYTNMRTGAVDFWRQKPSGAVTIVNQPASEVHSFPHLFISKPKLILTSPPYPGIHVVYHRWQVFGKRETPAPFWIANSQDGHGLRHYAMGGRKQKGLVGYFDNIKKSFSSVRKVCDTKTLIVQILAFSEISWQLPKYLETMEEAGYTEVNLNNERIWREVPNRKWYAQQKGKTQSSKEVILFHKPV